MLYRCGWVLLLWYSETDRNRSIQERELKDCEFARCRENEHDSLESMMSFITNRCWVLVHVLEFYACIWWFWHKKLLLSLTFHHNPYFQNTECALHSLDPMTCLKGRHSSCRPSYCGEMHSFSVLGMLPTLHFYNLNVSQINHICIIIGGSCGYQIFVLDLICSVFVVRVCIITPVFPTNASLSSHQTLPGKQALFLHILKEMGRHFCSSVNRWHIATVSWINLLPNCIPFTVM